MRIAIHDYAGFAFPLELSRELSTRDHSVLHLYTQASGGPKASFNKRSNPNLQIINIDIDGVQKDNFLKRWFQEQHYGDLAEKEMANWGPDVIISANTPLVAQRRIIRWAHKYLVPSLFWLQDLLSVAAKTIFSNINQALGRIAYAYLSRMERESLFMANHVVSITDDFSPYLKKWNIDPAKVTLIPNWGPIERIPALPRNNQFSEHHGLNGKFVVLYSGTLGKKQDIQLIADAAVQLANDKEIIFVVATDDRGHRLLKQKMAGRIFSNLLHLPLQSSHQYPYLLASSDITLVTLEASASTYCVPSKLWSAFCAQKPSIVSVDKSNLCSRITDDIGAGIVVQPGSTAACCAAIRSLKQDRSQLASMGINARKYAERNFPISTVADKFEAIIHQITAQ
jgi:glycosyltransferase involved in cell wall biosynthesis